MAAFHHPYGQLRGGKLHAAMEIQVLAPARVAGDHHPRADIVPAVARTVAQDRQAVQVRIRDDHLLAGGSGDHSRR
jgi:hypothetical protein